MPWPVVIAGLILLAGKLSEYYKNTINLAMLIPDRFADISFSLFIALETDEEKEKEWLLERYYDWLRFAVYAFNPTLITIAIYDLIKTDDDIKRFWHSDEYLKKTLEAVEESIKNGIEAKTPLEAIEYAIMSSPIGFAIETLKGLFIAPYQFVEEYSTHIIQAFEANRENEQVALTKVFEKFKPEQIKEIKLYPVSAIYSKINPFLIFMIPQIIAHIKSMYAYSRILHLKNCPKPPRQLLELLDCDVFLDDKQVATIKVDKNNMLKIELPIDLFPLFEKKTVCFDYAGIKKCVEIIRRQPVELRLTDKGRTGGAVCNVQGDFPTQTAPNDFIGDWWINCNSIQGDSYSLAWLEFEHNQANEPFAIEVTAGAYREACYGTAYLCIGYKEGSKIILTPVVNLYCTQLNPCPIRLYGSFPSPRFIVAVYHYCPSQLLAVSGARITRVRVV